MKVSARSVQELRRALGGRRAQIVADLSTLGARFEEATDLRAFAKRHPLLAIVAGGALGVLIVRRPRILVRAAGRIAAWGAPLVLSTVAKRLHVPRRQERAADALDVQ